MIDMKKTALGVALGLVCGGAVLTAQAATLSTGDVLTINAGVNTTTTSTSSGGKVTTTVSSLCTGTSAAADGSCFGMQGSTGFAFTSIAGLNGIVIGTAQAASGSHSGAPNGSESPNIDQPWDFFNNTGMDQTLTAVTQLTNTSTGGTLNFSGWDVTWNGIASIPMGSGGVCITNTTDGLTSTNNCSGSAAFQWNGVFGSQYQLWYNATVPLNDPSGFGGVNYRLHLVGTVQAAPAVVPVPATVWLLGSGLIGLVGVARRKRSNQG